MAKTTSTQYAAKAEAIRSEIARLQGLLNDHARRAAAEPANWGFIGDLEEVERRIREVADFIDPAAR